MNPHIIHKVLTRDWLSRKKRFWPLIPYSQWNDYKEYYKHEKGCAITSKRFNISVPDIQEQISKVIKPRFPFLAILLEKYFGHLILCGGAFTENSWDCKTYDVDLFFYDCTVPEAEQILKEAVDAIVAFHADFTIRVERKQHLTNVVVFEEADHIHKYQFIHRIYPDIGSILGGFDLGPSMIAWDGVQIWATELGAWSIVNECMIIDISRRSTTFGKRILKYYHRGFRVVFPGFRNGKIFSNEPVDSRIQKLHTVMQQLNLKLVREYDYDTNYPIDEKGRYDPTLLYNALVVRDDKIYIKDLCLYRDGRFCIGPVWSGKRKDRDQVRKEQSDYGDWTYFEGDFINRTNNSLLINGNLDPVTAIFDMPAKMERPKEIIDRMLQNPNIPYLKQNKLFDCWYDWMGQKQCRQLAEFEHSGNPEQHREVLYLRMLQNLAICRERLKKITWITKNPGRQWTSSINPAVINARDWYGEKYRHFIIGVYEKVETLLRLARTDRSNVWSTVPREIFNMIMYYVVLC